MYSTRFCAKVSDGRGTNRLGAGGFSLTPAELMERFNASIGFDRKLLEADIAGSVAYARALQRAGVLSAGELEQIEAGLKAGAGRIFSPGLRAPRRA